MSSTGIETADAPQDGAVAELQKSGVDNARSPSFDEPQEDAKLASHLAGGKAAAGGVAVINQREAIPTTGKRMPTTRWEYISFCIFCTKLSWRQTAFPLYEFLWLTSSCYRLLPQWRS